MDTRKLGRNDPCLCGSGLKYKRCCLEKTSFELLEKSRELFVNSVLDRSSGDMTPFHEFFPEVAENENRCFWSDAREAKSREPFQIIEFYCSDPKCDCNRVVLAVADRNDMESGTMLSVGFAFDRKDPDAGPYIDPLNPITKEGRELYPIIENMLNADLEYIARLKRHYDLVKTKVKSKRLIRSTADSRI